MKVLILGGGVSGLLAAKAIRDTEPKASIVIMDKRECKRPHIGGLHYLHDNCGEPIKKSIISNIVMSKEGTYPPVEYCKKIFGEVNETAKTNSLTTLPAFNQIYDMGEMVDNLLEEFKDCWVVGDVIQSFPSVEVLTVGFDLVISTIPFPIINQINGMGYDVECNSEEVYATLGLPEEAKRLQASGIIKNFTMYNTFDDAGWYRTSSVFGREFTEWLEPVEGCIKIKKLITAGISQEGVYQDTGILITGRYGEWNRSRLAHEVYYQVVDILRRRMNDGF